MRWLLNTFRYLRGTISTESRHVGKRSLQVGHPFDNSQITGKPEGISPKVNANGAGSRKNRRGAKSSPQALKRENILDDLTARLKSRPSRSWRSLSFSANCEVVPFPMPFWRASLAGQPRAGRPYAGG